jgi:hypothetical protein
VADPGKVQVVAELERIGFHSFFQERKCPVEVSPLGVENAHVFENGSVPRGKAQGLLSFFNGPLAESLLALEEEFLPQGLAQSIVDFRVPGLKAGGSLEERDGLVPLFVLGERVAQCFEVL